MILGTAVEVLDPTVRPLPEHAVIAKRPRTLDGTRLGLLANGKRNADALLGMLHDVLSDSFEFRGVVEVNKGNASRPCPPELLSDMAEECDVVITASGD